MLTLRPIDPQTVELCQESPETPCSWSNPYLLSEECSQIRDNPPWIVGSAIYGGSLHSFSGTTATISNSDGSKFDAKHAAAECELIPYPDQLASTILADEIFHIAEDQPIQVAEQRVVTAPTNSSFIKVVGLGIANVGTTGDEPCDTLDLQAEEEPK
jgi:hypothetical protein